ncbi:hypothetical protein FRC07_000161 [Ceratobasidium sp. 392]|nr:hypothetical protein FRC07_000161 [Ceratobasidium sp. 392]
MIVDSSMTEIAVAVVTVAVGAAFYFGTPRTLQEGETLTPETSTNAGRTGSLKKGGKKGKKKTMPGLRATSGEESTAAEEQAPAPKRVEKEKELTPKPETPPVPIPTAATKAKKKKNKGAKTAGDVNAVLAAGPSQQGALTAASESEPSTTDGAWTRVETKRRAAGGSTIRSTGPAAVLSDGLTTSVTGTEDEQEDVESVKPRTLAERLLPTGRKTGVEDMLESPQYPDVARVMRVKPTEGEQPAAGYTWGDYEDVDENKVVSMDDEETDEGGWGVVTSRRPQRSRTLTPSTQASKQPSTENLSKKQRQNAAKRDAAKAAKAESEAERQARLAAHKRQLERERIAEQYAKPAAGKGKASGGMTASVNEKGSLVWD